MGYNFHPATSKGILASKMVDKEEIAVIFDSVMKKYEVGLVLDRTQKKPQIKIPRTLQKNNVPIAQVKKHITMTTGIDVKKYKISYGDGSGGKTTGNNAAETKKQERGTALYFENYFEKGKHSTIKDLARVYPKMPPIWLQSYILQVEAFESSVGKLGHSPSKIKGMVYSRDTGIMPYIDNFVLKNSPISNKDSWNPADIYVVKKTAIPQIKKDLSRVLKSFPKKDLGLVYEVNKLLKGYMSEGTVFPVSLKKMNVGKPPRFEISNYKKVTKKPIVKVKPNSVSFKLNIVNDNFANLDMNFNMLVDDQNVKVQLRPFSTKARDTVQIELTPVGGAAKLGKVSTNLALKPFLSKLGLKRVMGKDLPRVGQVDEKYLKRLVNSTRVTNTGLGKINFYVTNLKKDGLHNMVEMAEIEEDFEKVASRLSAKIQHLEWLKMMHQINQKGLFEEFLVMLYHGAKKTYALAGPFIKIY